MKNFLLIICITICTLISACSSTPDKLNPLSEIEPVDCHFPGIQPKAEAPSWVCTGYLDNVVTGLGVYAESDRNYNLAFQIAQQRARADLAQKIETKVKRMKKDFESITGNLSDNYNQSATISDIEATLRGSRVVQSITDANHSLYVLVGIDRDLAAANLARSLGSTFGNVEAAHIKAEALKAFDELLN